MDKSNVVSQLRLRKYTIHKPRAPFFIWESLLWFYCLNAYDVLDIFNKYQQNICYLTTCHFSHDLIAFGIKLSNRISIFNFQATHDVRNFSAKNDCQSHAKGFAFACKFDAYGTHIAFDTCQRQILLCVVISYWWSKINVCRTYI